MILIFRHVDCEGPGYLAEFLDAKGYPYRLVAVDAGDPVAIELAGITGLVFMGGSMSVNDDLPWIENELQLIRKADAAGIPILGHCLGAQLLAKALGAEVSANRVQEIGWYPVQKTAGVQGNDWLAELPTEFMVYHWHGETFSLPQGAQRILENAHCDNQGFVVARHIGLQCHVEMTEEMVKEWTTRFAQQLEPSASVQSRQEMLQDLRTHVAELKTVADVIYTAWLESVQSRKN
jgi:GMP synthase-like glutamine amidotransferase